MATRERSSLSLAQIKRCREIEQTYHAHCNKVNKTIIDVTTCKEGFKSITNALIRFLNTININETQPAYVVQAIQKFKQHLKPCWLGRETYYKKCIESLRHDERDWQSDWSHAFARDQYQKAWFAGQEVFQNIAVLFQNVASKKKKKRKKKKASFTAAQQEESSSEEDEVKEPDTQVASSERRPEKEKQVKKKKKQIISEDVFDFDTLVLEETSEHMIERITTELTEFSFEHLKDMLTNIDLNIDVNLIQINDGFLQWRVFFPRLTVKFSYLKDLIIAARACTPLIMGVLMFIDANLDDVRRSDKKKDQTRRINNSMTNILLDYTARVITRFSDLTFNVFTNPEISMSWSQMFTQVLYWDIIKNKLSDSDVELSVIQLSNNFELVAIICEYDARHFFTFDEKQSSGPDDNMFILLGDELHLNYEMSRVDLEEVASRILSAEKALNQHPLKMTWWDFKEVLERSHDQVGDRELDRTFLSMPIMYDDDETCLSRYCLFENVKGMIDTFPCLVTASSATDDVKFQFRIQINDFYKPLIQESISFHVPKYMSEFGVRANDALVLDIVYASIEEKYGYCVIEYVS